MTGPASEQMASQVTAGIRLSGRVQGLGMRPAIARLASEFELDGSVRNTTDGVSIVVQGDAATVDAFVRQLPGRVPAAAGIQHWEREEADPVVADGFHVDPSDDVCGSIGTTVPVDVVVCEQCQREVLDPEDRRHGYAFTSCTDCGPRYSLTDAMPWDRELTSMVEFPQCEDCRLEYESAADRRFHAQTNACSRCGPQLECRCLQNGNVATASAALDAAADVILSGGILALKGIGGYQLVCDATSSAAVQQLRQRKGRPRKPLAVMVPSVREAERFAIMNGANRAALTSPANPIVLMEARTDDSSTSAAGLPLSTLIHPHLRQVGLMLPSSPLHLLLLDRCQRPCVVTSGNLSSDPLVYRDSELSSGLDKVADAVLRHDRDIRQPIDDSVVRVIDDCAVTLRCARGLAPLPLSMETTEPILALGAHQKVALALATGQQAVLGPHLGDLESSRMRLRFIAQADRLCELYQVQPKVIAHDLHPDLFTTRWAAEAGCRTIAVQHHHAHVVSAMVENDWLDREVLGVAFDGTGYGTDGTIWGGEFLRCTATQFERVARLRPFVLIGGERAVREPWRVAMALLHDAVGSQATMEYVATRRLFRSAASEQTLQNSLQLFERVTSPQSGGRGLFPISSSGGRLFDGIAALLLDAAEASYEGEPAMKLEAVCDVGESGSYRIDVVDGAVTELDWRPMLRQLLADLESGTDTGAMAMKVINGISGAIAAVCRRFDDLPVVLTGGCFQNRLLTEQSHRLLVQHQTVGLHQRIPPTDGGLSAGQLAVAAARLREMPDVSDCGGSY